MTSIIRISKTIRKNFMFPLLLLFWATREKEQIIADVRRWVELDAVEQSNTSDLGNLLALLAEYREFRNVYYFRAFHSTPLTALMAYSARMIYRESPTLFIRKSCNIGPGLFIQHGFCAVINADIGKNCWINQQVSIGFNDISGHRPSFGDNVRIGAGAKILGGVTLGDNVIVGANAVVVKNVPANCVVVGVPAYIVKRDGVKVREDL